jgi:hypothetical protein
MMELNSIIFLECIYANDVNLLEVNFMSLGEIKKTVCCKLDMLLREQIYILLNKYVGRGSVVSYKVPSCHYLTIN